jgi:hypothetical protein
MPLFLFLAEFVEGEEPLLIFARFLLVKFLFTGNEGLEDTIPLAVLVFLVSRVLRVFLVFGLFLLFLLFVAG